MSGSLNLARNQACRSIRSDAPVMVLLLPCETVAAIIKGGSASTAPSGLQQRRQLVKALVDGAMQVCEC